MLFNNGNPAGTCITSLTCINQNVGGLLMAGSCKCLQVRIILEDSDAGTADGIMHLYRNYDATREDHPLQMVTSFRVLPAMVPVRRGSGLVLDWQQNSGTIIAGGDSRSIRMWDAHKERIILVSADVRR